MGGFSYRFYLLIVLFGNFNIIQIGGEDLVSDEDIISSKVIRKRRNLPSLHPGSFDYCKGVDFTEKFVTKGSGSVLGVLESKANAPLTWYEAAACCRSKGLNLANINNEGDLRGYFTLRNGNGYIGWSDVHGLSNQWRNLKGYCPEGDVWDSTSKPPLAAGKCREIGIRKGGSTFHLFYDWDCNSVCNEILYCEEDDPLVPMLYDNEKAILKENILWNGPNNAKFFYDNFLRTLSTCEQPKPRPSTAVFKNGTFTMKYPYENNRFLTIKDDNLRCRALGPGQHSWPGRCDIYLVCNPVREAKLQLYNTDVYKCPVGRYFVRASDTKDWRNKRWPCKPITEQSPCKAEEPKKFTLTEDDIISSKGKLSWMDANDRCIKSGLILATVENKEDNEYLLNNQRLKGRPYNDNTKFWTGGKMTGADFDDAKLIWQPSGNVFPNHNAFNSNGVSKKWDEFPVPKPAKGITCISMRFPGTTTSHWAITDCNEKNYYICMREIKDRGSPKRAKIEAEAGGGPLTDDDVVISKGKLTWNEALDRCKRSGLVLASVENQDDNNYLSKNRKLHSNPYDEQTRFWTAGKLKGASFDDATLVWESTGKLFPNHLTPKANGVNKIWEDPPNPKPAKGIICLDINFPSNTASVWSISNCNEPRYYICMRTPEERDTGPTPKKVRINGEGESEPDYEPDSNPTPGKRPRPQIRPSTPDYEPDYEPSDINKPRPRPPSPSSKPGGEPLTDDDVVISKGKLTWNEALDRCKRSGLVLASVENQDDNNYLGKNRKLHSRPYDEQTRFWTAGKLKGTRLDDATLMWESTGKLFPNHLTPKANGVNKMWTDPPIPKPDKGIICLDINFPSNAASVWSISNCNEPRYYICMRTPEERDTGPPPKKVKITGDVGGDAEPDYEPDSNPTPGKRPKPPTRPSTPLTPDYEPDYEPSDINKPRPAKYPRPLSPSSKPGGEPLTDDDVVISKGKLPWIDAVDRCKRSGLVLASVENQDDNNYLGKNRKLHSNPYDEQTRFWTAGKLKGTRLDDATLVWESTGKLFPNHLTPKANGVNKVWKDPPIPKPDKGIICLDINFPSNAASVWSISNCNEPHHYICMRTPEERDTGPPPKKVKITGDGGDQFEPDFEPNSNPTPGKRPKPPTRPSSPSTPDYEPGSELDPNPTPGKRPKPPTRPSTPDYEPGSELDPNPTPGKRPKPPTRPSSPSTPDYEPGFEPNSNPTPGKRPKPPTRPSTPSTPDYEPGFEPESGSIGKPRPKPGPRPPSPSRPKEPVSVTGTFIPDANPKQLIRGNMKQGQPSVFKPDNVDEGIKKLTPGTFKPDEALMSEWPYSTLHGTMKPYTPEPGSSIFVPDSFISGEFKPDSGARVYPGSMTQDDPSIFTPDSSPYITKPIPGTWKPNLGALPNHPCQNVHGTMFPIPGSQTEAQFTPDAVQHGVFIPDEDPKKQIKGTVTQANPPEFIPSVPSQLPQKPTSGTWKPKPGDPASASHGVMNPSNEGDTFIFVPDEVVEGQFIPDESGISPIDGFLTKSSPRVFSTPDESADLSKPIPGTWKRKPGTKGVGSPNGIHGILKPDSNVLPINSAFFNPGAPSGPTPVKSVGTPGKFYPDDMPKMPVPGSMSKSPPFAFTPRNPTVDFKKAPKGTWIPDVVVDPNDPNQSVHGKMSPMESGLVFTPDSLLEGIFIPDSNQVPLEGTMNMTTKPTLFSSKKPSEKILKSTPGRWRPTKGSSPLYPYSTVHGIMKPTNVKPNSAHFTPDIILEGEFKPDGDAQPILGGMTQGTPAIFTPNEPADIVVETPGTWKPLSGISANHPFVGVHGSIKPVDNPDGGTIVYYFVPYDEVSGTFVPDALGSTPFKGKATQSNPSKFLPDDPSIKIKVPVSGTWKPIESFVPDDPLYYTHCSIGSPNPGSYIFIADKVVLGKFTADGDNAIKYGIMTLGTRPVFKPDSGEFISIVIRGTWTPTFSKIPVHGALTPPALNELPLMYVFFILDSPAVEKPAVGVLAPDEEAKFVQDEPEPDDSGPAPLEEDCGPGVEQLGGKSKFFAGCKKGQVPK